jgi:hypothetical protein
MEMGYGDGEGKMQEPAKASADRKTDLEVIKDTVKVTDEISVSLDQDADRNREPNRPGRGSNAKQPGSYEADNWGNRKEKTLDNSSVSTAKQNVPDIDVVGGDLFRVLCKASSRDEGWMKSTKAMQTPHGCLVQVTTQQRNNDGTYAVAEALAFVPGVKFCSDGAGGGTLGKN